MHKNYLICSTPRTGSTLLCQYLTSTEVAGRPHSYFRKIDMLDWAKSWRILNTQNEFTFSNYLVAARAAATSTENGVIGIRVMWESLEDLIRELKNIYPNHAESDLYFLEQAFGDIKFIHMYRNDVISQAISLYRAELTGHWHTVEGEKPAQHPEFNFEKIKLYVDMLRKQNLLWEQWFNELQINPIRIAYEDLSENPIETTKNVLNLLDIKLPAYKKLEAPNQKLADKLTITWKEEFNRSLQN